MKTTSVFSLCLLVTTLLAGVPLAHAADDRSIRLLEAVVAAYPDHLAGHDGDALIWKDGTRMAFDDGRGAKNFDELLNAPDLQDQFYAPYELGAAGTPPGVDIDPGRVRYEPFFAKMYGDCRTGDVSKRLAEVVWLPRHGTKRITVTRVNGVAERLQAVSDAIDALPDELIAYLTPTAGTFNCRAIAGTSRMSVHGFGAAIDINVKHADYWRWAKPDAQGRFGPVSGSSPATFVSPCRAKSGYPKPRRHPTKSTKSARSGTLTVNGHADAEYMKTCEDFHPKIEADGWFGSSPAQSEAHAGVRLAVGSVRRSARRKLMSD